MSMHPVEISGVLDIDRTQITFNWAAAGPIHHSGCHPDHGRANLIWNGFGNPSPDDRI